MNIKTSCTSGRGVTPRGWGIPVIFAVLFLLTAGCRQEPAPEVRQVILDVDTSVDDLMSILYLLEDSGINICAITIANGVAPADSGLEIVRRLLNLTGHADIPVARGELYPLVGSNSFPLQWQPMVSKPFGLNLPDHPGRAVEDSAAGLMTKMLEKYRGNIDILALGPLTNVARVLLSKPSLAEHVNRILVTDGAVYVEGGIYTEYPAVNNRVAGWNLWVDPRAADVVFASGADVMLVPLDITAMHGRDPLLLTRGLAEQYTLRASGIIGESMADLMNSWVRSYQYMGLPGDSLKGVPVWDLVACMIYRHPGIAMEWQEKSLRVREGDTEVAGQIVIANTGPVSRIVLKGNQTMLDSLLLETADR
jgi:inosine-uridine nucleoside N-ribohydrolase